MLIILFLFYKRLIQQVDVRVIIIDKTFDGLNFRIK
jgi:hypothetical protein